MYFHKRTNLVVPHRAPDLIRVRGDADALGLPAEVGVDVQAGEDAPHDGLGAVGHVGLDGVGLLHGLVGGTVAAAAGLLLAVAGVDLDGLVVLVRL